MAQCGFCGVNLTSISRAKEHVYRRSWLERLGHSKTPITGKLSNKDGVIEVRNQTAASHLAGEVCKACNNGWMNHLDSQVEPLLMPLITEHAATANLTPKQGRQIARWLLKTAVAHELADRPERRHLTKSFRHSVRRADWLPSGLWIFTCQSAHPQRGLNMARLDMWPLSCAETIKKMPQSQRLKFGVGYDNLLIGCCVYMGKGRPTFVGIERLHYSLFTVGADVVLGPTPEAYPLLHEIWNHPEHGQAPVNMALGSIGLVLPMLTPAQV